jgi:hypothetical protein
MTVNNGSLLELGYVSKAVKPLVTIELVQLFDAAYKFNQAHGITGILFYENQYFAQIIEGKNTTVSALWKRIQKDPRHEIMRELSCHEIKERNYPHWSMRFFGAHNLAKNLELLRDNLDGLPGHDDQLLNVMRMVAKRA